MPRLLMIALLALWGVEAGATQVSVSTLPCPMGTGSVKVYEKMSANTHGGFDSDLAAYSTAGQFRAYALSTCPDSLFTLYGEDMKKPVDEAQKARLGAALADELTRVSSRTEPAIWERYGIAARMYREMGRDPLFLAELYLTASHTARDQAVDVYEGLQGPAATRALLDQGAAELKKSLPVATRKVLLYNLARVAARGGYVEERDAHIKAFVAAGGLTAKEKEAVGRFTVGVAAEAVYQDLAIAAFQSALRAEMPNGDKKIRSTYLLADLLRRRGRYTEALPLYALVMSHPEAPPNLREMALLLSREITVRHPAALEGKGPTK